MSELDSSELLVAGKIAGCYGVKGWVKIHSYTEPPENFFQLGDMRLKRQEHLEPVEFDQGRAHGKGLVGHIVGLDDRTRAEAFCGLEVVVPLGTLPELDDGEFYWRQLEGLEVWCTALDGHEAGKESAANDDQAAPVLLGTVDYLIETGANDVLVVKAGPESIDDRERLIPYLPDETVKRVDVAAGRIDVEWFLNEE